MHMPDSERDPDEKKSPGASSGSAEEGRLAYFIRMLSETNETDRWKAAQSLGRTGDSGAVEPLINALWDDDSRVRLKAAWALGETGDIRAIMPLRRLYRIEKEEVREIIAEAIEKIQRRTEL